MARDLLFAQEKLVRCARLVAFRAKCKLVECGSAAGNPASDCLCVCVCVRISETCIEYTAARHCAPRTKSARCACCRAKRGEKSIRTARAGKAARKKAGGDFRDGKPTVTSSIILTRRICTVPTVSSEKKCGGSINRAPAIDAATLRGGGRRAAPFSRFRRRRSRRDAPVTRLFPPQPALDRYAPVDRFVCVSARGFSLTITVFYENDTLQYRLL